MTTPRTYKLEIHIDSQRITKESLEQKTNYFLQQYLEETSISLEINTPNSSCHQLIINGDIESVDQCHNTIQQKIINKENLMFYRYIDEAGDEIRYKAYPILAYIEQRFRVFVNESLVEILGFDWWEKYAPQDMAKTVNPLHSKYKDDYVAPSVLECTFFDHLIELIFDGVSEFSSNKLITINQISSILESCQTIDEFKAVWNEKTRIISLLDILSKYFEDIEDKQKWTNLQKDLKGFVVDVRNNVMHHRPIGFFVIKKLDKIKEELIKVFDSAKPELSEEERIEAQQEIKEMKSTLENLKKMMTVQPSATENLRKMMTVQPSTEENLRKIMTVQPSTEENLRKMIYQQKKSIYPWMDDFKKEFSQSLKPPYSGIKELFEKSIIETEEFFEDEIESDLLNEEIEENNEFDDINSNEDNIIADENELDQNS